MTNVICKLWGQFFELYDMAVEIMENHFFDVSGSFYLICCKRIPYNHLSILKYRRKLNNYGYNYCIFCIISKTVWLWKEMSGIDLWFTDWPERSWRFSSCLYTSPYTGLYFHGLSGFVWSSWQTDPKPQSSLPLDALIKRPQHLVYFLFLSFMNMPADSYITNFWWQ